MAVCCRRENFFQILLQGCAHERIKRAERLIEQEQFRRKHERAHQTDALALSAGKLGRITIERLVWKLCERAKLARDGLAFRFRLSSDVAP